jgi:hypothetical protein
MQTQHGLLVSALYWHEAHARARDRLADRFGIVAIVLASLAIRDDESRGHDPHAMAKRLKLATPVVSTGTRLHADQARGLLCQERHQLRATEAFLKHRLAPRIDPVQTECILCQIDPDRCNVHEDSSCSVD